MRSSFGLPAACLVRMGMPLVLGGMSVVAGRVSALLCVFFFVGRELGFAQLVDGLLFVSASPAVHCEDDQADDDDYGEQGEVRGWAGVCCDELVSKGAGGHVLSPLQRCWPAGGGEPSDGCLDGMLMRRRVVGLPPSRWPMRRPRRRRAAGRRRRR